MYFRFANHIIFSIIKRKWRRLYNLLFHRSQLKLSSCIILSVADYQLSIVFKGNFLKVIALIHEITCQFHFHNILCTSFSKSFLRFRRCTSTIYKNGCLHTVTNWTEMVTLPASSCHPVTRSTGSMTSVTVSRRSITGRRTEASTTGSHITMIRMEN